MATAAAKKTLSPQEKSVEEAKRNSAKKAKFVELAQKRMSKALGAIAVLENLANKNSYSYEPAQVDKMTGALTAAVNKVIQRFKAPDSVKASGGFQF